MGILGRGGGDATYTAGCGAADEGILRGVGRTGVPIPPIIQDF